MGYECMEVLCRKRFGSDEAGGRAVRHPEGKAEDGAAEVRRARVDTLALKGPQEVRVRVPQFGR